MSIRNLSAALLLGLFFPWTLPGAAPVFTEEPNEPPFSCFTEAWDGPFEVISTHYDPESFRVTWVLEAKKDLQVPSYEAKVNDGDGVKLATLKVKFIPDQPQLKKGTKVKAVVSLNFVYAKDVAKVNIRQQR